MKVITNALSFLLVLFALSTSAQSDKYKTAMQTALKATLASKTPAEYAAAANQFNRIAGVESGEWLPVYYVAYCNLAAGLYTEDKDAKDAYFDTALGFVEKAEAKSADNSEILALKGYVQLMKMSVAPMSRMSFMKNGYATIEKAIQLNPANPRPYLIKGQHTFYTPKVFGGGSSAAKPILEQASAKFKEFKPATEIDPVWGEERLNALLAECK